MVAKRLCVVGDYAWDVLIQADSQLLTGGDSYGDVALAPGGSAANVAVWSRRCGQPVDFIGKVGNDRFGQLAEENLADEGVIAHLAIDDAHGTGSVAVYIDATGQRSMVSGQGADHYLEPSELPQKVLTDCDHLHFAGWGLFTDPPRSATIWCVEAALAGGATVSFDPSSFQLIEQVGRDEFVATTRRLKPSLLLPNVDEGRVLTGKVEPQEIVGALAEMYPDAVIVLKLDADGALVLVDSGVVPIAPATDNLVDATGAGDSFAGAFIARWLATGDAVSAAVYATEVAAWVVQRLAARPEPDAELAAILARF